MGRVLLARQRSLDRDVAVKVPRDAGRAVDLRAESLITGRLEHPNIVPVHALHHDPDGHPVLVMKRIEGVSWETLLRAPDHAAWAPLRKTHGDPLAVHLWILGSICHAVHFAHSRGVVHRDIKPDNVMVGAFGEVYLVDWGIATEIGAPSTRIVGTPAFVAPEMLVEGTPLDPRTDVYLLGATLHYALVGKPRHTGDSVLDILEAARRSAPFAYPADVPEELAAICNRATHVDPAERFATAEAFREAIADYLRHRGAQELCDAACRRLDQLVDVLASADGRRIHELSTESLFGFHESLRAWPDNPRATDGLRRCLRVLVDHELGQENLARARALLDELVALDGRDAPELAARVTALEDRVTTRAAREAKLAELEHARDWRVAARHRVAFFLVACAVGITMWQYALRDPDPRPTPPTLLAIYMLAGFVVLGALVVGFRRRLLATAVTRHLVLGVLCCIAAMAAHRALAALAAPPTATIMSGDLILCALAAALGGVTLARWMWLFVPLFGGAAVLARLVPEHAGTTFVAAATLALAIGLVASAPRRPTR